WSGLLSNLMESKYNFTVFPLVFSFFFSSRRRHTRFSRDWSSDVCSSDLDADAYVDVGVGVAAQGLGVVAALGGVLVLVALLVEAGAGAEQLLASPADGAEGLGQDDLEVGQLGVDVVVGLGADLLGLLAGLGEDPVGLGLGAAGDLGAGDQGAALGVRGLDDPLGLLAGLLDHLLPAADQLLCLGEGVGQRRAHLVEHREQFGAVDHARRRHGHRPGTGDRGDDLVELLL